MTHEIDVNEEASELLAQGHHRLAAITASRWNVSQLRRLIGGKVLIEREPGSERMSPNSLIIIPDALRGQVAIQARYATGFVRAMGPGMKVGMSKKWKGNDTYRWPMPDVALGARVIYRTWAVRADFERDGKKYDLVSDEVVDVEIVGGEDMAKFRPLYDRILVKRVEADSKTPGGIIIPDIAKEKPIEGKVLAVGKGRIQENGTIRPLDMVEGDRVLFGKYSGTEIHVEGVECVILREDDVLGIIDEPSEGAAAE
jgi:chaperonin GroES